MQTIVLGHINSKGLLHSTGNYTQCSVKNRNEKEYMCVYICITESLCYTAEFNNVNQLYFNKINL